VVRRTKVRSHSVPSTGLWADLSGKKRVRRGQFLASANMSSNLLPSKLHSDMRVQSMYQRPPIPVLSAMA